MTSTLVERTPARFGWARVLAALAALAVVLPTLYLCARFCFYTIFSRIMDYDDEGAMLLVLRQLRLGHPLYDQTVVMYGPMGFFPKLALVWITGWKITHDLGRAMTMAYWLFASAAAGITAWRLGRSVAWFALAMVSVCVTLFLLAEEPGHPQDFCCVMIALGAALASFVKVDRRIGLHVALGIAGGFLLLTKINLGIFFLGALGSAYCLHWPKNRWQTPLRCLAWAGVLALPWMLMRGELDIGWVRSFAADITISGLACLVVATASRNLPAVAPRQFAAAAIACAASAVVVCLVTLALGTSPGGLLEGIILLPLHIAHSFHSPAPMGLETIEVAAIGLALAGAMVFRGAGSAAIAVLGIVRLFGGAWVLYQAIGNEHDWIARNVPPLAWIVMLPVDRGSGTRWAAQSFGRMFLAFGAVLEAMWAYPVYGHQVAFAAMLPVTLAVVSISDGMDGLAGLAKRPAIGRGIVTGLAAILALLSLGYAWLSSTAPAAFYDKFWSPLNLPGSELVRLSPEVAKEFGLLTQDVKTNADTFYTLPGMNSLYIWTGIDPPTTANVTAWMYILSDAQQQQAIAALQNHPRACLVFDEKLLKFWMEGRPPGHGPMLDYLRANFRPAIALLEHQVWVRRERYSGPILDGRNKVIDLGDNPKLPGAQRRRDGDNRRL